MSEGKTPGVNGGEEEILFRRSIKGYNMMEVDEYISTVNANMDALRKERDELARKLAVMRVELEKHRKNEMAVKTLYDRAESEAEKLYENAKSQAAKLLADTESKCNKLLTDTKSECDKLATDTARQVKEQRQIFEATRGETNRIRKEVIEMCRDLVDRMNLFADAASECGTDVPTAEEIKVYAENGEDTYETEVSEASTAETLQNDRSSFVMSDDDFVGLSDAPSKAGSGDGIDPAFVFTTDDFDEFEGFEEEENGEEGQDFIPVEFESEADKPSGGDGEDHYADDFGDDFYADDDSNEFYTEDDDEFYPSTGENPITGTVSSFGFDMPKGGKKPKENKHKVKKTMSLTDEFDAVAAEDDD